MKYQFAIVALVAALLLAMSANRPAENLAAPEPFLGEISVVGFNFAPRGWALCDGQLLPISQHTALFSLLGTTYGGDGRTTFALPDLRGRVPIHMGQGPGLTNRRIGERSGAEAVALLLAEMPSHNHLINVSGQLGTNTNPAGLVPAVANPSSLGNLQSDYAALPDPLTNTFAEDCASYEGGNQAHPNMQPYLTVNFIIALEGVYPSRN